MILLSFDIEEFDAPLEYGGAIDFATQIRISEEGLGRILEVLDRHGVKATFFVTANFAVNSPESVRRIVARGHELASHGYFHSRTYSGELSDARQELERLGGVPVIGYRSPRMSGADDDELRQAGYRYNSSMNPTYLPGRYNHLKEPRSMFLRKGIVQIPSSVSSVLRLPLFWLALHNFPLFVYEFLCRGAIRKDGYLNVYFHPWEFSDELRRKEFRLPGIIRRNSGRMLATRLEQLVCDLKKRGYGFSTLSAYMSDKQLF